MVYDQDRSPREIEVLQVGDISASEGILSVPLRVYVDGAAQPEGDIVLILNAQIGGILSGKLQSRVPQALRQLKGKA
jgi:hypothetical protein